MFTAQRLIESGNKTVEWASGHLNEDGSFGGVEERILAYYKAPMAFALAGRVGGSHRGGETPQKHLLPERRFSCGQG